MFKTRYKDLTIQEVKELLDKQDRTFYEEELVKDIKERIYNYYCNIRTITCGSPCRKPTKEEVKQKLNYDKLYSIKKLNRELIDFIIEYIMTSKMI